MAQLAAFWAKLTILVSTMRFSDIVDILIVAYLIYNIIMLIRKTNSFRLARGILLILIALWLSGVLKLTMFNRLLQKDGRARTHRARDHFSAGAAPPARAHGQQNVPELWVKAA